MLNLFRLISLESLASGRLTHASFELHINIIIIVIISIIIMMIILKESSLWSLARTLTRRLILGQCHLTFHPKRFMKMMIMMMIHWWWWPWACWQWRWNLLYNIIIWRCSLGTRWLWLWMRSYTTESQIQPWFSITKYFSHLTIRAMSPSL